MSRFSEYAREVAERADGRYFGEGNLRRISNKYFTFKHALGPDEMIIATANVSYWFRKDQWVLWVANDKVVYLKPWQVRAVRNAYTGAHGYLVKLSRGWFRPYRCFTNESLAIEGEDGFDSLMRVAEDQDRAVAEAGDDLAKLDEVAWAYEKE